VAAGLCCRGWKLWLAGALGNPLLLVVATSPSPTGMPGGAKDGWNCLFADVGPLAVGICLLTPLFGLAVRWISRRDAPSARPR